MNFVGPRTNFEGCKINFKVVNRTKLQVLEEIFEGFKVFLKILITFEG